MAAAGGDQNRHRRRANSHQPSEAKEGGGKDTLPRRSGSLRERYPGDMSHRPLAMLTKQHRAADRAPHLHNHRRQQPSDTIDTLDITGPVPSVYHHSGPFDATLKSRNTNKKYSPVEAVKETNAKALKATPPEYIQDSLVKHMPLQGTAVVPPGMKDMAGRTMHYEEGADMMREEDAAGGAYKRWEHIRYHPDDFKGKGEPSFSHDQARRAKQPTTDSTGTVSYEMQPTTTASSSLLSRDYDHNDDYGYGHGKAEEGVMVAAVRRRSMTGLDRSASTKRQQPSTPTQSSLNHLFPLSSPPPIYPPLNPSPLPIARPPSHGAPPDRVELPAQHPPQKGPTPPTTARVEDIDDAFQCSLPVTIEYPDLTSASRRAIWGNFLRGSTIKSSLTDKDIHELAELKLNGRQIKNVLKTAQLLAAPEEERDAGPEVYRDNSDHREGSGKVPLQQMMHYL
ncbi:hypothetical protein CHGG_01712 [Chaetomium globosum CBS 148.51]|uniref:Uncharacterized protein n=1 Tax=Chaetomium globosum (strain ATCC 6205 / CBS 148.51 / DSM 1962 / NBRC 6347 / NRRL 1970) TaxID=306901 RepID=Q2HDJ2_CHAGB|nr:uncharacterized protein CHGG_01712 [Chaetomium globosum CBS 148.51]EAQ93477.1 hypothetical protein CHGG_01712 [Chaetomium globosum CBS 148.51]